MADFSNKQSTTKGKSIFSVQLLSNTVASIFFLVVLATILWQLPRQLEPVQHVDKLTEAGPIEVNIFDANSQTNQVYPDIQTERRIREIIPGTSLEKIQCTDAFGRVYWEKTLEKLFKPDAEGLERYVIGDTLKLEDNSWSILFQEYRIDFSFMAYWRIIFAQDGQEIRRDMISSSEYSDSDDSFISVRLTSDGGWILSKYMTFNKQFDYFLLSRTSFEYLARFDQNGQELWRIGKNSQPIGDSAIFTVAFTKLNYNGFAQIVKNHGQLLPAENSACYLILQDNSMFARTNHVSLEEEVSRSNAKAMRVILLGQDGQLVWQRYVLDETYKFEYQTSCINDGIIYICANDYIFKQHEYVSEKSTILALSKDGELLWQINVDQYPNYGISDILVENDCLTVLLTGFDSEGKWRRAICQFSLDGQLISQTAVDPAINYVEILAAKPGTVWIDNLPEVVEER